VEINGFQHKVCVDDKVISEKLGDYDINDSIVFEKVLMIGTKDFTAIGRPFVLKAKVFAYYFC
jgi:ribosomal protein L21